jgi:hypothetical protein
MITCPRCNGLGTVPPLPDNTPGAVPPEPTKVRLLRRHRQGANPRSDDGVRRPVGNCLVRQDANQGPSVAGPIYVPTGTRNRATSSRASQNVADGDRRVRRPGDSSHHGYAAGEDQSNPQSNDSVVHPALVVLHCGNRLTG